MEPTSEVLTTRRSQREAHPQWPEDVKSRIVSFPLSMPSARWAVTSLLSHKFFQCCRGWLPTENIGRTLQMDKLVP